MNAHNAGSSILHCMVAVTLLSTVSFSAQALDNHWLCANDLWSNGACWSTAAQPLAGDNVFLTSTSGSAITVDYDNVLSPGAALNSLIVSGDNGLTLQQSLYDLYIVNEIVGDSTTGAVVQTGGSHNASRLILGNTSTGIGSFEVNNAARLSTTGLNIGQEGTGTLLVQNGGTVFSSSYVGLGIFTNSVGSATVDGAGSSMHSSYNLDVGGYGSGTLNVQNDAAVSTNGILAIGAYSDGNGTLNITSGGNVSNTSAVLGDFSAGTNGVANIDGIGSTWTNTGSLTIGNNGTGTMNVQNGATVTSVGTSILGAQTNSSGSVTVSGANQYGFLASRWNNNGGLYVGDKGNGTLHITNSSSVSNSYGIIGSQVGSSGSVIVENGSTWTNNGLLNVGVQGDGTLIVREESRLFTNSVGIFGVNSSVIIDESYWNNNGDLHLNSTELGTLSVGGTYEFFTSEVSNTGDLYIGAYNGHGQIDIHDRGTVSNVNATLGSTNGSGTVNVDGLYASWNNSGKVSAGFGGVGTINITNGGTVTNTDAALGENGIGNATVDGAGSLWANTGELLVGIYSGTGTLNITNGGTVTSTRGSVGSNGGTGSVSVSGAGSRWDNSGLLLVGGSTGNTVNLTDGGVVTSLATNLGRASVTIDGAGSSWNNSEEIYIGEGGSGAMNISNGGALSSANGYVSTGVSVDGNGSRWTSSSNLEIGTFGAGSLNITNGGVVSNTDATLGSSFNGAATVGGNGSVWTNSGNLTVGIWYLSGTGTLNIENGGRVDVGGLLDISQQSAVNLTGGTLVANSIDTTTAGSQFNFTGGTLAVETFNGNLVNQGGTLAPGSSPGTTTINGDYSQDFNSTLSIELGGLLPGTEFDVLNIMGTATLGGTLEVNFYDWGNNLFSASLGDSFDILSAETLFGEFDALSLAMLGNGLGWQIDYLIDFDNTTDIVRLSVVSAVPIPAAAWLFASGLLGLVGVARRKASI